MASTNGSVLPRDHLTLKHNAKTHIDVNMRSVMEGHERKSLQTLQQSAHDENTLVVAGPARDGTNGQSGEKFKIKQAHGLGKIFFEYDHSTPKRRDDHKAASMDTRSTQTDDSLLEGLIQERLAQRSQDIIVKRNHSLVDSEESEAYQLLVKEPVPDSYWEEIAEQRRLALNDTLEENRSLHEEMDSLREENEKLSELANQAACLSSFLQSVVSDDEDNVKDDDQAGTDGDSSHVADSYCGSLDAAVHENEKHGINNQATEGQTYLEENEHSINSKIMAPQLSLTAEETDSTENR